MCKKLNYIMLIVLVLGLALPSTGEAGDPDLVGWWKLNETSGTVASDSSGLGNDGTCQGDVSWVDGMIGGAWQGDGDGDYIQVPHSDSLDISDAVTVALWVYGGIPPDQIIGKGHGDATWLHSYGLRIDDAGSHFRLINFRGREGLGGIHSEALNSKTPLPEDEWTHVAVTFDVSAQGNNQKMYFNGQLDAENRSENPLSTNTDDVSIGAVSGTGYAGGRRFYLHGMLDDVRIYRRALSADEIRESMLALPPELAVNPIPADEATDVPRDVVLSWTPGESAAQHDVYFSDNFDDVNDADRSDPRGVLANQGQNATTYDTGRLDFSQTYYWRIDEVNAPPDSTIFKGYVWSFTVEPFSCAIENVTATASSSSADQGPENTVNGSGLDVNDLDLHSTELTEMWLSNTAGPQPTWIQYEFDKVYKLHEMLVWNHNGTMESMVGIGFKDVSIEYSVNGTDYTTLGTTHEFAQGTGSADYEYNTTVDFGGTPAKFVRLTANSNWVGFLPQYGLSEVRFLYIPVFAREPGPDSGATDVDVDVTLGFRAGREAAKHDVYLSTDEQAVIDGTAPVNTVTENSYSASLDVDSTYYWRIDEVNDAETPTTWQGDIWNFTTPEYLVVDDFESYNDLEPGDPESNRIFNTWIDGYGTTTNGSIVGYDVAPFAEQSIVYGGNQSMPYFYDNNLKFSEAELTLSPAQDWTKHGVTTLVIYFRGEPSNTVEQMYVKVNGSKVLYSGDAADISQQRWRQWDIPLEELANQGVDLQNVTQLVIGFGDEANITAGGTGVVYFDDIRLYQPGTSDISSITITVPNGDFEEIYKPGSNMITADLGDGWTQGIGPDTPMDDGIATYSDGTTGDSVDIPGWIGADPQGWLDNGGSYDRDPNFPNRQGSVARQSDTPDGLYYYLSNGGGWGNQAGGLIVSDEPLTTVEGGLTYTLSMLANGGATPVVLELLANGVALTPSSSVDPVLSGDWQEFSRTYDAASLDGHLGESLTIRLGVGRGAIGGQSHFDAVSLSYVPEPVSLIEDFDSLAVGSNMHDVDGWEGWFGDAQWGAQVTDVVAYSGTNSLEIVGNRDDLVPNWPQQTTGKWMLSVMQYCPSDKQTTGQMFFGPLTEYDGAAETVGWIGEFIANFETGKAYCNADQAIQVDLLYDDWAELFLEVDLDAQKAHFYYNNVFLSTQPAPSIAGVDIWPDENIVGVYFDDFRFEAAE